MLAKGDNAIPATLQLRPELSALAEKINQEHQLCGQSCQRALLHAKYAGDALSRAQAQVPYGSWISWCKENCPNLSRSIIKIYIRIAKNWDKVGNALSINQALEILTVPKDTTLQLNGRDYEVTDIKGEIITAEDDQGNVIPLLRSEVDSAGQRGSEGRDREGVIRTSIQKHQPQHADLVEALEFQLELAKARIKLLEVWITKAVQEGMDVPEAKRLLGL